MASERAEAFARRLPQQAETGGFKIPTEGERLIANRSTPALFVKNFLFTVLVPGTVAGFLPYRIVARDGQFPPVALPRLLLAGPVLVLGAAIYFWCLWAFAVTGRGTPAPIDPPKQLVVRRLYRYVRNPMYLGVLLVIAGWAVTFGSGAVVRYVMAVALLFHLFVVLVEEPLLRRRFGPAYETYRQTVRRWVPQRPPT